MKGAGKTVCGKTLFVTFNDWKERDVVQRFVCLFVAGRLMGDEEPGDKNLVGWNVWGVKNQLV